MSGRTKKLEKACRRELRSLWSDLATAVSRGINTSWSIQCENLAWRIRKLTLLVGPTSWESVSVTLLEEGVYQRLHAEWGIEVTVDMDRVAQTRASIDERSARGYGVQPTPSDDRLSAGPRPTEEP